MTEEMKKLIELIAALMWGEIIIKKENGKIVLVRKTETIKLK